MVGFSKFIQSLWGTQSRRTPPIHPFLLPGLQEETVIACRSCNMWLQGKVWSNLDSIEMTSLCMCSWGVSLCPCGKFPLPSSLKLCTPFVLLTVTPGSSESLAHLISTRASGNLAVPWAVLSYGHWGRREDLPTMIPSAALLRPRPFGLSTSDLLPSTKLLHGPF